MFRTRKAWKTWATELADHDAKQRREDPNFTATVDRALAMYAKAVGFAKEPPLR